MNIPDQLFPCQSCSEQKSIHELMPVAMIRGPIVDTIRKLYPDLKQDGYICFKDLNHFRAEYFRKLLEEERGELSALDREVAESMKQQELLTKNVNTVFEKELSLGSRVADKVASFGGSWKFIILFLTIIIVWIFINAINLMHKPFDPFPFILLNLVLSCIAAVQAPIIMMSQNRQESKDRLRAEHDYKINLKAELEIRHINEKIDHLLKQQWMKLMEIQQVQMELMEEMVKSNK